MRSPPQPPSLPPNGSERANERLDSWKEIAAYLRREVRTVQRWELEQGLPIHRLSHHKRSSVYAFKAELDVWLGSRAPEPSPATPAISYAIPWWRRPAWIFGLAGPLLLLVLLGAWEWSKTGNVPFQRIDTRFLMAAANSGTLAISPDSRFIAYTVRGPNGESLWVREVAGGSNTQILAPSAPIDGPGFQTLAFSSDSKLVRFVKTGTLYQIPVQGGDPLALASGLPSGHVYVSPDQKRLAFRRASQRELSIVVADVDGAHDRPILRSQEPGSLSERLSWSPDGKKIALSHNRRLISVEVESGRETTISPHEWATFDDVAWLPNGSGLFVITRDPPVNQFRPWFVPYPAGEAHPILSDLMDYPLLSPAGDSQSFAALQSGELSSLWVASAGPKWKSTKITQGQRRKDGVGGLAWGSAGRIVYVSSPGGVMQIWTSRTDGTDAYPLTEGKAPNFNPSVCPDGTVVFNSGAPRHIWKIQADGSRLQQLTSGLDESWPICSADGQSVLFLSTKPAYRVMKIPLGGGAPETLTEQTIIMPSTSPDGKSLLGTLPEGRRNRVVVTPLNGGPARRLFDVERPKVQWSPDGKSVLYAETTDGVADVWRRNLDGSGKERITSFADNDHLIWFDVARDGRLLISRGETIRDIVQVRDLR